MMRSSQKLTLNQTRPASRTQARGPSNRGMQTMWIEIDQMKKLRLKKKARRVAI